MTKIMFGRSSALVFSRSTKAGTKTTRKATVRIVEKRLSRSRHRMNNQGDCKVAFWRFPQCRLSEATVFQVLKSRMDDLLRGETAGSQELLLIAGGLVHVKLHRQPSYSFGQSGSHLYSKTALLVFRRMARLLQEDGF